MKMYVTVMIQGIKCRVSEKKRIYQYVWKVAKVGKPQKKASWAHGLFGLQTVNL